MDVDLIADTNFFIYTVEGNKVSKPFLKFDMGYSFISEVELLGHWQHFSNKEADIKQLLQDCQEMPWNKMVKKITIKIRRTYGFNIPDAIIAATALVYNRPLVTADRNFSKVESLEVILLEP